MAICGISRIDDLNSGAVPAMAIAPGDTDTESVGLVQQMLTGQGQKGLPNLLSPSYGTFGPLTTEAVRNFRIQQGLLPGSQVDVPVGAKAGTAYGDSEGLSRGQCGRLRADSGWG